MHKFLKKLNVNDVVDCVYVVNYKYSNVSSPKIARNGNKFLTLRIKDASLANNESATVLYYYNSDSEIDFLQEGYNGRTSYLKISGRCFGAYPNIQISSNSIIPANEKSGIIFDTSNLYAFSDYFKNELLSVEGKSNVALRHTSCDAFQNDYDLISVGTRLEYKRILNSEHDKYQINVFIENIDDVFNIPAYLTPTMAKLIDDGYKFTITVINVPPKDDESGLNAGIRVNIKGVK